MTASAERPDFGYSWVWSCGHLLVAVAYLAGSAAALALGAPRWTAVVGAVPAAWGLFGFVLMRLVFRAHAEMTLKADRFLAGGSGGVLDLGCGSGRTSIMVARARPGARITALDDFSATYIRDHGEERLTRNLRVTGVADRVEFRRGDMLSLPFGEAAFDAAVSTYALDHLREKIPAALAEAARVIRPGGDLLLGLILPNVWTIVAFLGMPLRSFPRERDWRRMLGEAGFEVIEVRRDAGGAWILSRRTGAS